MTTKQTLSLGNQAGFTLLEIIAVMVIMSILAVVAIPKYFDLQAQAREKALDTAMAEAIGRVNGYFAKQVLNGVLPKDIDYDDVDPVTGQPPLGEDMGDFKLATVDPGPSNDPAFDPATACVGNTAVAGCLQLTVTPKPGTATAEAPARVRIVPRPGF